MDRLKKCIRPLGYILTFFALLYREAGLIAGALLATNYVYVMWNRAALMEASMVAFMVAAWYCYVRAQTQPLWGVPAAACALLAYFTKAAAIFFVAALGIEAVLLFALPVVEQPAAARQASRRAAISTLAGLAVCGIVALALFVVPNWTDYRFYNWQMSVTRKPSYDLRSLMNRVTWFPIVHDIFTRMWFTVVVGVLGLFAVLGPVAGGTASGTAPRTLGWTGHARVAPARRRQRTPLCDLHSRARGLDLDCAGTGTPSGPRSARDDPTREGAARHARRLLRPLRRPGRLDAARGALRTPTRRSAGHRRRAARHGPPVCHVAKASKDAGRPSVEPGRSAARCRAGRCRPAGAVRAMGAGGAPTRTISRRSSSAPCCRRVPSCTASWPTGSRSRTASSLSSWDAGSVTTTIESNVTMCGIF